MSPTIQEKDLVAPGAREALHASLRRFYGQVQKTGDLSEGACCTIDTSSRFAEVAALVPQEVRERQYGCGCPIPADDLTGLTCLDLGSGAGFDAFILAKLVGPSGFVHGIDMTKEQLDVARRNVRTVMDAFGHADANVAFHEGFIETAEAIPSDSIDLVVSDCVVNLSPAKQEVIATMWRTLKEGGELYVADVVADRRVPEELRRDPVLVAECLGGALYEHDWLDALRDGGFKDPRVVERRLLRTEVKGVPITFWSTVTRAQKLTPLLDNRCEDYGQLATYTGGCAQQPARFVYDDHHVFEAGRPTPVCRNTARMLAETRLARYFQVTPPIRHFGLFDCGPSARPAPGGGPAPAGACC